MGSQESNTTNNLAIRVKNLQKKFGSFTAVHDLTVDIYKGEIFGFLGPNGAGKTTSINMICGLSPSTAGEVEIFGKKIKDQKEIKTHIGICPQENIFWQKLTCFEQLVFTGSTYGLTNEVARERSLDLLNLLGLQDKKNVHARKLSGGMKRRLNICLALIHDPEILVLDEPEAGLDPQSRILVRNFIKSLAKKKTIILTTHNMDEANRLSDRVAIIDHGKLLLLDTPEKLKKSLGEGDMIEIRIEPDDILDLNKLKNDLKKFYDKVIISDTTITIKSKNLIESVAEITDKVKKHGFKINEMTMRENTLEDVFIHLTGRKLRE